MTLLHEAFESKKFDTRVVERNIDRGLIQSKDHEKFVKELPDDSANADYISIETIMGEAQSK